EVSAIALCDGERYLMLASAQDHKRVGESDTGPNTGGMGAYAPLPWAPPDLAEQTMAEVIAPAIAELARRGTPYRGLLYAGLALTKTGVKVIEFNARFGDPETQVVLDRLATPLAGLLAAAADGDLAAAGRPRWVPGAAVTVVIAAHGYPGRPAAGDLIENLEEAEQLPGAYVLQAGTAVADGALRSAGGRVLNVVGTGQDVAAARAAAYAAAARIRLNGSWYRTDIAAEAGFPAPPLA
ncbi:MAG TPA: phosphoribosylglycinamide synthetase C domain-containing protein, partial [Streptosporangiaceae bacterium]